MFWDADLVNLIMKILEETLEMCQSVCNEWI